ncbi:hypothetical protein D3C76_1507700 [compost metagenome]
MIFIHSLGFVENHCLAGLESVQLSLWKRLVAEHFLSIYNHEKWLDCQHSNPRCLLKLSEQLQRMA